LQNNIASALNN